MITAVKKVTPKVNHLLELVFSDGSVRIFDLKPLLKTGVFKELNDLEVFNTVRVSFDTVAWANDADLDPEYLFEASVPIPALNMVE